MVPWGGGQISRWMLKPVNHFAKIFSSFCSLKGNKNKENEMPGEKQRYRWTWIFNAKVISFCISIYIGPLL
jgi:hypothetical protein